MKRAIISKFRVSILDDGRILETLPIYHFLRVKKQKYAVLKYRLKAPSLSPIFPFSPEFDVLLIEPSQESSDTDIPRGYRISEVLPGILEKGVTGIFGLIRLLFLHIIF